MWSLEEINNYVKETIKGSRYSHTLGVVENKWRRYTKGRISCINS